MPLPAGVRRLPWVHTHNSCGSPVPPRPRAAPPVARVGETTADYLCPPHARHPGLPPGVVETRPLTGAPIPIGVSPSQDKAARAFKIFYTTENISCSIIIAGVSDNPVRRNLLCRQSRNTPGKPRRGGGRSPKPNTAPQKKAGRPPEAPSTIVNLRLPVALLAQLDRYIDRLEVQTGLKANRGMIARRALALFLETHATDLSAREGVTRASRGTGPSVVPRSGSRSFR